MSEIISDERVDKIIPLVNKLLEDDELIEKAAKLFVSLIENNREQIFFSLDEFDLTLREFCVKHDIELGGDGLHTVINTLFYHYSQLEKSSIVDNLRKKIEENYSQDQEEGQYEIVKNDFMNSYAEIVLKNLYPLIKTISPEPNSMTYNNEYKKTDPLVDNYLSEKMGMMYATLKNLNEQLHEIYFSDSNIEKILEEERLEKKRLEETVKLMISLSWNIPEKEEASEENLEKKRLEETIKLMTSLSENKPEKEEGVTGLRLLINLTETIFSEEEPCEFSKKERAEKRILQSFENAFTKDDEFDISRVFQESFSSIREIVVARPDYQRMKNFSETIKKIVWFLSAYLIAYPKTTLKHSRQEILENLLENIYKIYNSIENNVDSADTFSPLKKIGEIEKLLNGFLPKSGKKTLASIVKYSLNALTNVKKEFEKEPQCYEVFIIDHEKKREQHLYGKSILNYKYTLKINDIINGESYLRDLATVPFAHIKKERKKFREAFMKSSILRQFFQFLTSFFKKNDEILTVFKNEKLLEKMPTEILGDVKLSGKIAKEVLSRKRIYHFFKVAKTEASKKVKIAQKGLKKQIKSANNRGGFFLHQLPKANEIASPVDSPVGSPSERGRAPSRLNHAGQDHMLARDFVPYDMGGPLI